MTLELPLTKANRLRIARAFRDSKRVDLAIDCVLEGQMGRAFVDDLDSPAAFMIVVGGTLHYLAGDARSTGGRRMVEELPPYRLLMPSPPAWLKLAREFHGEKLVRFPRYSFLSEGLSLEHLDRLLEGSRFKEAIHRIDTGIATQALRDGEGFVEMADFDSAEDFVERGIGYCLFERGTMVAAAYSSLVCSKGIEVSLFVAPRHRWRGMGTALGAALLKYCLEHNMDANWDAANPESCKLAEKLGYVPAGTYNAYHLVE